jgi:N-acyl-D-aspartate/D-glutamate deacylase
MYDVIIRNGTIVDGTGAKKFVADLAIENGRIAEIATQIVAEAREVIDATGFIVTPGFVGEAPMPRNLGLLSLRALNSVKKVFGA